MTLLELSDSGVSLEFDTTEWPSIVAELKRRADAGGTVLRIEPEATYDRVEIGDCSFILMNDWDEPCLIAASRQSELLLRALVAASPLPKPLDGRARAA